MPMNYPKRVLRQKVWASAVGTSDDLEFGPVPHGQQWYVEWASVYNADNNYDRWGVIVKDGGTEYWLFEETSLSDGVRYGKRIRLWLREGEELVIRVTGATASDALQGTIVGEYEDVAGV